MREKNIELEQSTHLNQLIMWFELKKKSKNIE